MSKFVGCSGPLNRAAQLGPEPTAMRSKSIPNFEKNKKERVLRKRTSLLSPELRKGAPTKLTPAPESANLQNKNTNKKQKTENKTLIWKYNTQSSQTEPIYIHTHYGSKTKRFEVKGWPGEHRRSNNFIYDVNITRYVWNRSIQRVSLPTLACYFMSWLFVKGSSVICVIVLGI